MKKLEKENREILKSISALETQQGFVQTSNQVEDEMVGELVELGKDRKDLESKLELLDSRINRIAKENEMVEKSILKEDKKIRKVLKARLEKMEWDKELSTIEDQRKKEIKKRKITVKKKKKERIEKLQNSKKEHIEEKLQIIHQTKEEKKKAAVLKELIDRYDLLIKDNKKLKARLEGTLSSKDKECGVGKMKQVRGEMLKKEIEQEAQCVYELDEQIELMQRKEEELLQQLSQSVQQKNQLKSQFGVILNKKLKTSDIKKILGEDDEEDSSAKKTSIPRPGTPNKGTNSEKRAEFKKIKEQGILIVNKAIKLKLEKQEMALEAQKRREMKKRLKNVEKMRSDSGSKEAIGKSRLLSKKEERKIRSKQERDEVIYCSKLGIKATYDEIRGDLRKPSK